MSRRHRKTDLKNAQTFPKICPVGNERVIHLSYLAPLLCLADELDIAIDRNISFLFDKMDCTKFSRRVVLEFGMHQNIRSVELNAQTITMHVQCNDASIQNHLVLLCKKLEDTLRYCRTAVAACSDFAVTQQTVQLVIDSAQ